MTVKTVVFDFGNVLCFFDHNRASDRLARHTNLPREELHAVLFGSQLEWDYECGRLTTAEFVQRARRVCGLRCSEEQFAEEYSDIFWPHAEAVALIPSLARRYRLLLLSNTNELHLRKFEPMFTATFAHFDSLFFSHHVGARKPDPGIFAVVQAKAECEPGECLFFDDLPANVAAAKEFGWQAVRFQRADDVRSVLG